MGKRMNATVLTKEMGRDLLVELVATQRAFTRYQLEPFRWHTVMQRAFLTAH
jgi:hypothetical protein